MSKLSFVYLRAQPLNPLQAYESFLSAFYPPKGTPSQPQIHRTSEQSFPNPTKHFPKPRVNLLYSALCKLLFVGPQGSRFLGSLTFPPLQGERRQAESTWQPCPRTPCCGRCCGAWDLGLFFVLTCLDDQSPTKSPSSLDRGSRQESMWWTLGSYFELQCIMAFFKICGPFLTSPGLFGDLCLEPCFALYVDVLQLFL